MCKVRQSGKCLNMRKGRNRTDFSIFPAITARVMPEDLNSRIARPMRAKGAVTKSSQSSPSSSGAMPRTPTQYTDSPWLRAALAKEMGNSPAPANKPMRPGGVRWVFVREPSMNDCSTQSEARPLGEPPDENLLTYPKIWDLILARSASE